jgi:hypothetical protein
LEVGLTTPHHKKSILLGNTLRKNLKNKNGEAINYEVNIK